MILYSEIGGHVLTPFLDTYLWTCIWELMKCRSAGERGDGWLTEELPMGYDADDKTVEYD